MAMKFSKQFILVAILGLLFINSKAQSFQADDVTGTWLTADKSGQITIYKNGNKYFGKIKSGSRQEKLDVNNPDKAKRKDPLLGLVILKDFTFNGSDEWKNGTVYDPDNGKTYRCIITLENKNSLKLRGYIGFSWIGRTEVWKRVN
jgi:uncharacterized protein (DUF2147 family)